MDGGHGQSLGPGKGGTDIQEKKKCTSLKDGSVGFSSMLCIVTLPSLSSANLPVKSTLGAGIFEVGVVL